MAAWHERSIYFSRTHVGMAVQSVALGLLGPEALHRVGAAAVTDFRRVWGRYGGRNAGEPLGTGGSSPAPAPRPERGAAPRLGCMQTLVPDRPPCLVQAATWEMRWRS